MIDIRELFVDRAELYVSYLKKVEKLLRVVDKHSPNSVEFAAICSTATYFKSAGQNSEHTRLLKAFKKQENTITQRTIKDLERFDDDNVGNGEVYANFIEEKAFVEECLFDLSAKTVALCQQTGNLDLKTEVAYSAIDMGKLGKKIADNLKATQVIMQSNLFDLEQEKEVKKPTTSMHIKSAVQRTKEGK